MCGQARNAAGVTCLEPHQPEQGIDHWQNLKIWPSVSKEICKKMKCFEVWANEMEKEEGIASFCNMNFGDKRYSFINTDSEGCTCGANIVSIDFDLQPSTYGAKQASSASLLCQSGSQSQKVTFGTAVW